MTTKQTTIIVHTKPNCPQCEMTKRDLEILGLEYKTQELTPETIQRFTEMGLRAAPVVEAGEQIWGGYDRSKIASLMTY